MDRRNFVKIATIGSAVVFQDQIAYSQETEIDYTKNNILGGERKEIPSACWQCLSRCAIVGYVKNNRLLKIEGNPVSLRNEGTVCAKGQAGLNQLYNPDRVTYPLKRIGERGSGKWEKISWDEAMDLLVEGGDVNGNKVKGLRATRDEGNPEKFLFHFGRMVGSTYTIGINYFLNAYGTQSIGDHDSICTRAGVAANFLTGDVGLSFQIEEADIVFNFGSSIYDSGGNFIPNVRKFHKMQEKGAKLITFDVRLSNTAAKSDEWIPVKSGTDLAVILAMCNVILHEELYNKSDFEEISNVSINELKIHLNQYTTTWAEKISGVPAQKIESLAIAFGKAKKGACIAKRGAFMHYNGIQARRAISMLDALAGNISTKVRKTKAPKWEYPFEMPHNDNAQLNVFSGKKNQYLIGDFRNGVSHQIASCIDRKQGKPEIYMTYGHNPVYSNGNCQENVRIYKDTKKIPFLVAIDLAITETTQLADLILPDTTYLERWALEAKQTPNGIPEYYLRQPMCQPIGESKSYVDMVCDISNRLNLDLGFSSAKEFVEKTCNNTPGIREAGGFEYMKKHGIWHDKTAKPTFEKRAKINLKSEKLDAAGFSAIPNWMPIPDHQKMNNDELILTSFKVSVQTHSRTQNCKWLTELYHENPVWINSKTADKKGIKDGDWVKITSKIGEMITKANVTQGIHPEIVAISNHAGHWSGGIYATENKTFVNKTESDVKLKWWKENGSHVNNIIDVKGEPISGSMCWFDTVVKVEKIGM